MSRLSEKQQADLNAAVLDYLKEKGCEEAAAAFATEVSNCQSKTKREEREVPGSQGSAPDPPPSPMPPPPPAARGLFWGRPNARRARVCGRGGGERAAVFLEACAGFAPPVAAVLRTRAAQS